MTAKQFFKSNAFKCLVTLLCVLLISGVLLTCAYGFMEVSKGERLQRAIGKIYPDQTVTIYGRGEGDELAVISAEDKEPKSLISESTTYGNATVTEAYKITFADSADVHYLVQSVGKHGFSEGTVTCWIAVNVDEANKTIKNIAKVSLASNKGQSFISKITGDMLESFTKDLPENGFFPDKEHSEFMVSGATKSSTAICNSVNGAIDYVKSGVFGLSLTDKYSDYAYTDYISTKQTSHTASGNSVTYSIVTTGLGQAGAFNITVTVTGGKITAYNITQNGSTSETWANKMDATIKDGTYFTANGGKTAADLKAVLGENGDNLTLDGFESGATLPDRSHATKSNFLCLYAGLFATANYQTALGGNA